MSRFEMTEAEAWSFLRSAQEVTVAAAIDGVPLVRKMHPAVVDGTLVLHGSPDGEKAAWSGPVTVAHDEVVARIPSYLRHPERACPATTWFRSVHLTGHVEPLEGLEVRARALQALMDHLQPEGGFRALAVDDPLYTKAIAGLGMWRIVPQEIRGKDKLGQHLNRASMSRVLQGLWRRGARGDLAAIEICRQAHAESVSFVDGLPAGVVPRCWPSRADVATTVAMVRDAYWNPGFDDDVLATATQQAAWVGLERNGSLVAVARALTDRRKRGSLYDVMVDPEHRGQGLGKAVVGLLLDHPWVRDVAVLQLWTRDAMGLYRRFGFVDALTRTTERGPRTAMVRDRRPTG